jgi:hypothetical protein
VGMVNYFIISPNEDVGCIVLDAVEKCLIA